MPNAEKIQQSVMLKTTIKNLEKANSQLDILLTLLDEWVWNFRKIWYMSR